MNLDRIFRQPNITMNKYSNTAGLGTRDFAALFILVSGELGVDDDSTEDNAGVIDIVLEVNGEVVMGGEGIIPPVIAEMGTEDVGVKVSAETPLLSSNGTKLM